MSYFYDVDYFGDQFLYKTLGQGSRASLTVPDIKTKIQRPSHFMSEKEMESLPPVS